MTIGNSFSWKSPRAQPTSSTLVISRPDAGVASTTASATAAASMAADEAVGGGVSKTMISAPALTSACVTLRTSLRCMSRFRPLSTDKLATPDATLARSSDSPRRTAPTPGASFAPRTAVSEEGAATAASTRTT